MATPKPLFVAHNEEREGSVGWFGPEVAPERSGIYECEWAFVFPSGEKSADLDVYFNRFDDKRGVWHSGNHTIRPGNDFPVNESIYSPEKGMLPRHCLTGEWQLVRWRGLSLSTVNRLNHQLELS